MLQIRGLLSVLATISAVVGACQGAEVDDGALTAFWKQNRTVSAFGTADYISKLHRFGVAEPNSLLTYTTSEEFRAQALYSMALIEADSGKEIDPKALTNTMSWVENSHPDSVLQEAGVLLLLNHYPENLEIMRLLETLVLRDFSGESMDHVLFRLGELSSRDKLGSGGRERLATGILQRTLGGALGGMSLETRGFRTASNFLAAVRWPMYQNPKLGLLCAKVLLARVSSRHGYGLRPEEFPAAVEYLINECKADAATLASGLKDVCCSETNRCRIFLWLLNDSRQTNAVAQKALDLFEAECPKNKQILEDIRAGTLSRLDAVESSIQALAQPKN